MVKTVFFGTPEFAVPTLERLLSSVHSVVAVVTQPDRPRGRGRRVSASPVKQTAEAHGLPVLQPVRMSDPDFVAALDAASPDLAVVAAYGRLLPDRLLELPRLGMINVHASLLPKYRGAAPIHRAIMAGETETGITIIQLVHEMDAGPMLCAKSLAIEPTDTSVSLERKLAHLGADLLLTSVDDIAAGRSTESAQDHEQATFAPKITRADGLIDWGAPAIAIHSAVRGLHPWPHAFSYVGGRRLLLLRTEAVVHPSNEGNPSEPVAGEILAAEGDRLIVAAGDHTSLAIHELQPEGRRALGTRAFLAGHRLSPGARFQQIPS